MQLELKEHCKDWISCNIAKISSLNTWKQYTYISLSEYISTSIQTPPQQYLPILLIPLYALRKSPELSAVPGKAIARAVTHQVRILHFFFANNQESRIKNWGVSTINYQVSKRDKADHNLYLLFVSAICICLLVKGNWLKVMYCYIIKLKYNTQCTNVQIYNAYSILCNSKTLKL